MVVCITCLMKDNLQILHTNISTAWDNTSWYSQLKTRMHNAIFVVVTYQHPREIDKSSTPSLETLFLNKPCKVFQHYCKPSCFQLNTMQSPLLFHSDIQGNRFNSTSSLQKLFLNKPWKVFQSSCFQLSGLTSLVQT